MAREDEFEDATDPGEAPQVAETPEGEEFPDAQIIVDQETGQHFIAFEIEPPEEGGAEGEAEKE